MLITLGIIGIVATLTMPSLVANYQKHVTITKLKKFYTAMSQAVKLSEADNGPAEGWNISANRELYPEVLDFYNSYFAQYINSTKELKPCSYEPDYNLCIYMLDGTMADFHIWAGIDVIFYTDTRCDAMGKCMFLFQFGKPNTPNKYSFEPYANGWNGTREGLKTHAKYGCGKTKQETQDYNVFCTKLIQYDGWEIKEDYPR